MKTLELLSQHHPAIPMSTSWLIADISESKGKQGLFTRQSPQKLSLLREHAIIESAVSSNRIEGVVIDQKRVGTVIFGKPLLKDRNEEEISGYRDVLEMIHGKGGKIPISESTIKNFHTFIRGNIWDAGQYKEKDGDIIESYPDGRQRVRFRTVTAVDTPLFMRQLALFWDTGIRERQLHPLVALAAYNLDFLCIHPFRDGNGRVSRLLLLLACYHLGYEVGRYISLERLIEENKQSYYETLEISSQNWHEGRHNPWPYVNYLLFILKTAYRELEVRAQGFATPKGAKTEVVLRVIVELDGLFSVADLRQKCPGVGMDMIRKILKDQNKLGKLRCSGRGPNAKWEKI